MIWALVFFSAFFWLSAIVALYEEDDLKFSWNVVLASFLTCATIICYFLSLRR